MFLKKTFSLFLVDKPFIQAKLGNSKHGIFQKITSREVKTIEKSSVDHSSEVYSIEDEPDSDVLAAREAEIEAKRNKSRLMSQHHNMLFDKVPYDQPMCDAHHTILYKRKMFGRYGKQSNINPGTLWPTKEELKESSEYEKVAHPFTLHDLISKAQQKRDEEEREIQERQLKIEKNLQKLEQWKREVANRAAKKLADLAAAKAKKDALIEDVRRHFGYSIDPKDEKFKEMLLQKEKEKKKKAKEDRAKADQERLLAMFKQKPGS